MRRILLALVALGLVVAIVWAPQQIVERRVAAALQPHLDPEGTVAVRSRASVVDLLRGRIGRLVVDARHIRLGDLPARRLEATLTGIHLARGAGGRLLSRVEAGQAVAEIGPADLERLLRRRGVENPSVRLAPDGVAAEGSIRVGTLPVLVRLRATLFPAGQDLRVRVTSLEVSGSEVPPAIAETMVTLVQPSISLRGLPVPIFVEQVTAEEGRMMIRGRVGGEP